MKNLGLYLFIALLALSLSNDLYAQCAMCKASVESNLPEAANNRAEGLNTGILYMMTIPYILFGIVAFLWYKNSKSETAQKIKIEQILSKVIGKK